MWSLYNDVLFSPWQPLRRYFLGIKIQRKKRKVNKKKRRKRKKERKGEREEGKWKLRIQLSDLFFELLSAIVCQCQIGLPVENLTSLPLYWTRKHIPRDPLSSVVWISDCQWKELVGELEGGRGVARSVGRCGIPGGFVAWDPLHHCDLGCFQRLCGTACLWAFGNHHFVASGRVLRLPSCPLAGDSQDFHGAFPDCPLQLAHCLYKS